MDNYLNKDKSIKAKVMPQQRMLIAQHSSSNTFDAQWNSFDSVDLVCDWRVVGLDIAILEEEIL